MTDETLFYRTFVEDVRACAGGRAKGTAVEIERRIRNALIAPPSQRDRRWARVVAAVHDLLGALGEPRSDAAERLRAFVRENADLNRPRDIALTDFVVSRNVDRVIVTSSGRSFLTFTPVVRTLRRPVSVLDEVVPSATRRLAEWTVYGLCGGAIAGALWFAFIAPIR